MPPLDEVAEVAQLAVVARALARASARVVGRVLEQAELGQLGERVARPLAAELALQLDGGARAVERGEQRAGARVRLLDPQVRVVGRAQDVDVAGGGSSRAPRVRLRRGLSQAGSSGGRGPARRRRRAEPRCPSAELRDRQRRQHRLVRLLDRHWASPPFARLAAYRTFRCAVSSAPARRASRRRARRARPRTRVPRRASSGDARARAGSGAARAGSSRARRARARPARRPRSSRRPAQPGAASALRRPAPGEHDPVALAERCRRRTSCGRRAACSGRTARARRAARFAAMPANAAASAGLVQQVVERVVEAGDQVEAAERRAARGCRRCTSVDVGRLARRLGEHRRARRRSRSRRSRAAGSGEAVAGAAGEIEQLAAAQPVPRGQREHARASRRRSRSPP